MPLRSTFLNMGEEEFQYTKLRIRKSKMNRQHKETEQMDK